MDLGRSLLVAGAACLKPEVRLTVHARKRLLAHCVRVATIFARLQRAELAECGGHVAARNDVMLHHFTATPSSRGISATKISLSSSTSVVHPTKASGPRDRIFTLVIEFFVFASCIPPAKPKQAHASPILYSGSYVLLPLGRYIMHREMRLDPANAAETWPFIHTATAGS